MKSTSLKYFFIIPILGIVTLLFIFSCGNKKSENAISEGVIEYKADVINTAHPLALYAPDEATVKLKNNNWIVEMSKMGFFNIYYNCNADRGTITQMIKFLDFKNACIDSTLALKTENDKYLLSFKDTKTDTVIAGYHCKKTIATKLSAPNESFAVYYTPDIGGEEVNKLTPYKTIKGMLMDYRITRLGVEMRFIAKKVTGKEIKDTEFEIPDFYKIISRTAFDEEFNKLFADLM